MTTITEVQIREGGKKILLTLDGATWRNPYRINSRVYSENIVDTSPGWVGSAELVTVGQTDPKGGTAASKIQPDSANSSQANVNMRSAATVALNAAAGYRTPMSIYARADNVDGILFFPNAYGSYDNRLAVDLSRGQEYYAGADIDSFYIEPASYTFPGADSVWWRIGLIAQGDAGDRFANYTFQITRPEKGTTFSVARNSDDSIIVAFPQTVGSGSGPLHMDYIAADTATASDTGFYDVIQQAIIDGLTSDGSEATGWNNIVRDALAVGTVERTSDTVVTITLPAFPAYDISADESVTATIPTIALNNGCNVVASPLLGLQFIEDQLAGGFGAYNYYGQYLQRKRQRDQRKRELAEYLNELGPVDREIARLMQKQIEYERRTQEIEELEELVTNLDVNQERRRLEREGNQRIANAYTAAFMERSFSSLERFEREMERAIEEEDFLLLMMTVL